MDPKKLKTFKGIAIAATHAPENAQPESPEIHMMLLSEFGTLHAGDFIWHFDPKSPMETRQRLPMWGQSMSATAGNTDVILLSHQGTDAATCSVATLRSLVNVYTEKGTRALPTNVYGMQSATWRIYRENQRTVALKTLETCVNNDDDASLIAWLEERRNRPLDRVSDDIKRLVPAIAIMMKQPVSFDVTQVSLLYVPDTTFLPRMLDAKATELGVESVTVKTWRQEGCIDFHVAGGREDAKKRKKHQASQEISPSKALPIIVSRPKGPAGPEGSHSPLHDNQAMLSLQAVLFPGASDSVPFDLETHAMVPAPLQEVPPSPVQAAGPSPVQAVGPSPVQAVGPALLKAAGPSPVKAVGPLQTLAVHVTNQASDIAELIVPTQEVQSSESKFEALARMALELKEEYRGTQALHKERDDLQRRLNATLAIVHSKEMALDDARSQEKRAIEQAAKYKAENERLCDFVTGVETPSIEETIVAHFSGKVPGSLSIREMFVCIPQESRENAIVALQCCMDQEKATDLFLDILRHGIDEERPSREHIHTAVSRVLHNVDAVNRIADAWERRDACTVQGLVQLETIGDTPLQKALNEMFAALF